MAETNIKEKHSPIDEGVSFLKTELYLNLSPDAILMLLIATTFFFFVAVMYGKGIWFIILFIAVAIVFIIINVLLTMGSQNNFQIGPITLFAIVVAICIYVFIGLYITNGIENIKMLFLVWGAYTLLSFTLLTVLMVGLFWSVVRKKTGMTGVRGIIGDRGKTGPRGVCSLDSSQNYTIKTLTLHLDTIFQQTSNNSNVSIIDSTSNRLINNYLNRKISDMATSHQLNMLVNVSTTNKIPVVQLVNYLKEVWTIWFNLIYSSGGKDWFLTPTADENGPWLDNTTLNPFDEIRKYDVYNWGQTRLFRPLKVEVCKSSPKYSNPELPTKRKPLLKIIPSNDYQSMSDDRGTGGNPDVSWWRAKSVTIGNDEYHPVGDIAMSGSRENTYFGAFKTGKTVVGTLEYDMRESSALFGQGTVNGPDVQTILVSGDVKKPVSYKNTWTGEGEYMPSLWRPVCPTGYVSLGDVAGFGGGNIENNNAPVCIPEKCVEPVNDGGRTVWNNGLASIKNINGWFWVPPTENNPTGDNAYNLMRTLDGTSDTSNTAVFYKIRPQCLNVGEDAPSTKELEPDTEKLGVGWYGTPAKTESKYSIFSFLGLVPEGVIVHQVSGKRLYIIHYGGEDVNKFNVLEYNGETGKFDAALETDSDSASPIVSIRNKSSEDPRQEWIVLKNGGDRNKFKLKSVHNGRLLKLVFDEKLGEAIYSTTSSGEGIDDGSETFSFIPAVGVDLVQTIAE